jgi:hypothetical protein
MLIGARGRSNWLAMQIKCHHGNGDAYRFKKTIARGVIIF